MNANWNIVRASQEMREVLQEALAMVESGEYVGWLQDFPESVKATYEWYTNLYGVPGAFDKWNEKGALSALKRWIWEFETGQELSVMGPFRVESDEDLAEWLKSHPVRQAMLGFRERCQKGRTLKLSREELIRNIRRDEVQDVEIELMHHIRQEAERRWIQNHYEQAQAEYKLQLERLHQKFGR